MYSEEQIKAECVRYNIPDHMVAGLWRYILHGVEPGHFLCAVLANDLMAALRRADDINKHSLPAYGAFLVNVAPAACFGSKERFEDWLRMGGLIGLNKKRETA